MNIKEAKEQIKYTVQAYLSKNKYGEYMIPQNKQRPIFLVGAPGIGKTAIIEQICQELNIGFLSYSMTHHTRQSALGLPYISEKEFEGNIYRISEYTMSEIIAAIYEKMTQTQYKEGILFLDEINCVSETLAPAMLQFLQYKVFGQHRVPEGWIIVTAGNPPEYNNSVREFDIVTMDRLKVMHAEPDYTVWRKYAVNAGIHNAILSYLDVKKQDFYLVQTTVDGKQIVTPRAWEDLSDMIHISETLSLPVTEIMVEQYIQSQNISKDFAIYYELYNKYKSKYQINDILSGYWTDTLQKQAKAARFDERMSLVNILVDNVSEDIRQNNHRQKVLKQVTGDLSDIRKQSVAGRSCRPVLSAQITRNREWYLTEQEKGLLTTAQKNLYYDQLEFLVSYEKQLVSNDSSDFTVLETLFCKDTALFKQDVLRIQDKLQHLFRFLEETYGNENEILIAVYSLTGNKDCVTFINQFGCDAYFAHNKDLLYFERQQDLEQKIETIGL